VSITLNTVVMNRLNHPKSFCRPSMKVRYEWSVTPGNTVNVTRKMKSKANRSP
jgi:hypothetical protein